MTYLVLSHTEPTLVARLTDRLLAGDPNCHVLVDHDRSGPPLDGILPDHPRLRVRTSARPGGWGGYGLVSAVLEALAAAGELFDPDWVVLLSGQDYPVRSPSEVAEMLAASAADAHLSVLREISDGEHSGAARWWHARYFYRWWALPRAPVSLPGGWRQRRINLEDRLSRAQRRIFVWTLPRGSGIRIGLRRRRTPFSPTFPCWAAYQWLALSRRARTTLQGELARRPELVTLYRRSIIPDESMLQTVLLNAAELTIAEPNLTFQRPTGPGDAHAADLELGDLPEILASGRAFARKMHPLRSASLMDALDRRLGLDRGSDGLA